MHKAMYKELQKEKGGKKKRLHLQPHKDVWFIFSVLSHKTEPSVQTVIFKRQLLHTQAFASASRSLSL